MPSKYSGYKWHLEDTAGVSLAPWLQREATCYKELIPWNRCLGSLNGLKFGLSRLDYKGYRYSLLRKACQFGEFTLYLRSMRIRIQHFRPVLFRIRFRNEGCNDQKFIKFYNLKKSYFSNKNLHEGRPRYRRSLLPFKKSSALQNYCFEVLNFYFFFCGSFSPT